MPFASLLLPVVLSSDALLLIITSLILLSALVLSLLVSYSERLRVHLLDKWLHAANRPVDHSVRCGRIHPQVSACILTTDDDRRHHHPPFYQLNLCVCVCVCCGQDRRAEGGDG